MARASTPTLLALDRFAKILGISPPHFNQGESSTVFPISGGCSDIWYQYQWQQYDRVSREELARAIYDAEQDIARELGYFPAPTWIAQEQHRYPRHHRRTVYRAGGLNVRGQQVSLTTLFSKFIQAGQRNTIANSQLVATKGVELIYDLAVDVLTATIILPTTFTNTCEVKVYFAGNSAAPEWEIRPARSITIAAGILTMVFDAWLFLDPDLWEAYPTSTAGLSAIDITVEGNYVDTVEVYREYNDVALTSATFYWEPTPTLLFSCTACSGTGCAACSLTSQDGCIHVRDVERGIIVPTPATYSDTDAAWARNTYTECRDPDMVKIYYYAGDLDSRWRSGATCEPLSDYWAHAIAWLAVAKLERPFCSCANVEAMSKHLRQDLAYVGESSYQLDLALLANPFGTKRGEIMAWKRVNDIQGRQIKGGAI